MMDKLLPCPFCGGEAAVRDIKEPSANGWVGCQKCRCFMDFVKNGKPLARAAWNRRADARQHALKTGDCPMCEDCPDGCPVETPKDSRNIITNADRIRSMSDEELARFLARVENRRSAAGNGAMWNGMANALDWLKQPAKEEV